MGKRLVICIPTYNRWEVVEDVLASELHILKKYQVDIILYDSGEGDETEKVCENYQQQGSDNMFYRRVASEIPSNQKVYMIYREMETSAYDYVWMIHDSEAVSEKALLFLMERLSEEKSFYVLNCRKRAEFAVRTLKDIKEFFTESAVLLTLYGASVVSVKKFIAGTDWKTLEEKYVFSESINFSHVGFYFERAAEIWGFSAELLELEDASLLPAPRHAGSGWRGEAIRIWTQSWASTILKLPAVYCGKREVIRSNGRIHLSKECVIEYKREGTFHMGILLRYWKWMRLTAPESIWHYLLIAVVSPDRMLGFYRKSFLRKVRAAKKRKRKILIYGAGKYAKDCARLFREKEISYEGFLVTDAEKNPEKLEDHPVLEGHKYLAENRGVYVVIAVALLAAEGIAEQLEDMGIRDWVRYEM